MGIRVGFEPHLESINTAFRKYFSHNNADIEFVVLEKPMRKNSGPFFLFEAIWFRITSVRRFIKDFDLIHVNSAKFGIVAYIASFFGCRYIYTIHSALSDERKAGLIERIYLFLEISLLKVVAKRAVYVTAVSQYCSQEIFRRFKIKPLVFYNGYDDSVFNTNKPVVDIKAQLGLQGKRVFISVGRTIEAKKPLNVVRFFAGIRQAHADAYLLLIGDGEMFDVVEKEVLSRNLDKDVLLIRKVPFNEIPDYYRASDYFISACEVEAFGLVVLEALGCGVLPLVPWKGAFPEILQDASFSYDINDTRPATLPGDELLKQRTEILNRFKWTDRVALYHDLYLRIMNKPGLLN